MMKITRFICLLFFCFKALNAYAVEVNINVDKKVMSAGDTLLLSIDYSGSDDATPDLTLLKRDFRIVSNSSSQQIRFINGNMSQSKKWTLGLQPLRTGKIKISPIRVGNVVSNGETVEVKEVTDIAYVPDSRENTNSPYFQIELKADNTNPYVQQQILLLVNIYDSIGIQDGAINVSEESKNNWIIIPLLSQPQVRQETINHKKMNVVTYAFAAFPQKSGDIELPQFNFDGYYIKNTDFGFPNFDDDFAMFGVNFRNVFGQRVPVPMKTKKETISVRPIPAGFSGLNWLPVNNLELSGNWSVKNGFKVGEAISRTVDLTAYGMTESMMPQIKFPEVEGFNQYPEKPVVSEQVVKGQLVTSAKINNVYIPTKPGNFVIPETKISWFNVRTHKAEMAILPRENVFVLPNSDIVTNTSKQQTPALEEKPETDVVPNDKPKEQPTQISKTTNIEKILSLVKDNLLAFILALLIVLFVIYRSLIPNKNNHTKRNAVIRAIKDHDYKKAKETLLLWAADKYYPEDINNFNDISRVVKDETFSECLSSLNKVLYADSTDYFDDAKFIEILKKVDKIRCGEKKKAEVLPNLYD